MNKNFIHLIIIVCLFLSLQPKRLWAETYIVGDGTYTSIQTAVNDASDGDEIIVKPGEYVENITVGKPLTIRSESGYTSTTVVAQDSSKSIFFINSNNITIQGFSLYGVKSSNSAAIYFNGQDHCIILNNRCGIDENRNNYYGIRLNFSENNSILQNYCAANYDGIYLWQSSSNEIYQNILTSNERFGLHLYYTSNYNNIYLNSFIDNQVSSIKSYTFQNNSCHSLTPITFLYNDQLYKSYLGNYYSDHNFSDTNNDGISDAIYNYPYFEPYDEYPLLRPHENYKTISSNQSFPPIITSIKPANGSIEGGTEVTINGSDFGDLQGNGNIIFGNIPATTIIEWSNTKIVCVVPPHDVDYITVYVQTDTQLSSNKPKAFLYYDQNIYVGVDEPVKTIQEAIHAASDGLTIIVRKGIYSENIVVNKSLVIQSENGWESTTITEEVANAHVFSIIADHTTIEGFTIYGSSDDQAAIKVMADYCTIVNNMCGVNESKKNSYGIWLEKTIFGSPYTQSHHYIKGNQLCYNSRGIYGKKIHSCIIQDNQISSNIEGVYLYDSDNNIISHNQINENSIYLSSSNNNILLSNTFQANQDYGINLQSQATNNKIFHNSFIDNQKGTVKSSTDCKNIWFSSAPLYYEYKGKSYKNKIGNYYSDHDVTDTLKNGITDNYYGLPYYEGLDKSPLADPLDEYTIDIWHFTDKHFVPNQITLNDDTVSINRGRSYVWVSSQPVAEDISYEKNTVWSGQLCLSSTPSNNTVFKIDIGVSSNGVDFISYGNFEIKASDKYSTFPFICEASPFTIPKNNYMAVRITNLSGSNYEIKVGSFNTFLSKPAISESPVIIEIEPEYSPTSGNTTITIIGSGFGNSQGNRKIMFGDVDALSYDSWSESKIVCQTPDHNPGRINVWVKKEDQATPTGTFRQFIFKDKTLFVGNNAMYPTIQTAINASEYSDTIIVKDGTYIENIAVAKPLTIRSENGYSSTTLLPLDSSTSAIKVESDNCLIHGFSIYNCNNNAIYVTGDNCSISSNRIGLKENQKDYRGIILSHVVGALITGNICQYNDEIGIYLFYVSGALITGNICENNKNEGISIYSSNRNKIIENVCYHNSYGIVINNDSNNNLILHNDCQFNINTGLNSNGKYNTIRSNNCERNGTNGIYISSTSDILLHNISQFNANNGIQFQGSLNIMFMNQITYNEHSTFSNNNTHLWNSPIKIYYAYNSKQYFNFLGNKYSYHSSSDIDNDGIYDEPYPIPDNNSDNYPLYSTPDTYTLQVWTLLPDSRLVNNFSDDVGMIRIESNDVHVWKAGANAINLTEQSLWTGQVIFKDAISDAKDISVIAGYVNTDGQFVASGYGDVSTVDDYKKRLTFQGIILPATEPDSPLAIQLKNNSSSPFDVITGGAWSFFSFGQGNSNSPPEVNDDTYFLAPGETFQVDAPGILQNDTDSENDALSIIIVQNVLNGTLTLQSNGGFTYIHYGSDSTSDTFTYKINDGAMDSFKTATVTLNIIQAPIIQVSPQKPISNSSYHVSISSSGDWIEYHINSSAWERYTEPFDIDIEGSYSIQARVKHNEDWLDASPVSFIIDQTPPSPPKNIISNPPENQCTSEVLHIEWDAGTDAQTAIAGYTYVLDTLESTIPNNQIDSTALSFVGNNLHAGDHYYFHISSVDTAGNVSTPVHIGYFCMSQNFTINASAGLHGKIEPVGEIAVQAGQDQTFQIFPDIGFQIDAVTIDGDLVNIQNNQFVFQNIDKNHQIDVSFTTINNIQPPEHINTINDTGGVILEWIDNGSLSYNVYRGHSPEGPFILIDPIVLSKVYHDNHLWYRIFDPFNTVDIQKQASYWYVVSSVLPDDGTISASSNPIQGSIDIAEGGLFRLIPTQQELEGIAGENVIFEIYVVPVGNFQDKVLLTVTYPNEQVIPEGVHYEFTNNNVKPVGSSSLIVELDSDAETDTFQINLNAQGGDRLDQIPLHVSILPPDSEKSFISAHIKQPNVRLDERIDINGHISVRKDEQMDLYGHVIPSEANIPILISIQNITTSTAFSLTTLTQSQGDYQLSFSFDTTGDHVVFAQYTHQDQRTIQSQPITLNVRKSIQNKIQCDTGNQDINLNQSIVLNTQITPPMAQTPIHFTVIRPESGKKDSTYRTDNDGKCTFNLTLDEAGIWEIFAYWEGNDQYEGQYSKSLYLYPGIDSPHAIIIAGGGYQDNPLAETTKYLADRFYKILIKRRLNDDAIMYMSSVVQEADGRVDKRSFTQDTITSYIDGLYEAGNTDTVNEKRPLIIYMVDHGGKNKFKLNSENILYADQLNECLNKLQEITKCKVQIIIDACYAGTFKTTMGKTYPKSRIIITSTSENNPSYYDQEGRESFSAYLFNWLSQGFSLGDSFSYAETKLRDKAYLYYDQEPIISDLQLADTTYLGGTFIQGDLIPIITNDHTPNQILTESSLEIYANIIDTEDSQCNVWASILPPNRPAPTYNENSSPQWQLETIQLLPKPEQPDIYAARYNCFYQKGTYVVTVYASDASDNISSKEIFLTVNKEQLPDGWGDIDHDAKISLTDAIMGLKQMSCMPTQSVDQDESYCTHKIDLAEVLFVLKSLAEGQYTDQ